MTLTAFSLSCASWCCSATTATSAACSTLRWVARASQQKPLRLAMSYLSASGSSLTARSRQMSLTLSV